MISLHRCADSSAVSDLKARYLQRLTAPMDGMWEVGFINPSPHWEIRVDGQRAGYIAANDDGVLLQFYVMPDFEDHGQAIFSRVLEELALKKATVNTIDPAFLSLCMDKQSGVAVHTLVYEYGGAMRARSVDPDDAAFRSVSISELDRTIDFQQVCLGADDGIRDWLTGYSSDLINREELFVLHLDDAWVGLGEYRKSDTQDGIVDVGMMVHPDERGKKWAQKILSLLVQKSQQQAHRPICSTTIDNVASQKAITRAGFVSRHRIMDISF